MNRRLSYLLAFSALSLTAFPQSIQFVRTSGPAAAPAIRNLSPGTKPAPAATPAPATKKLISGTIREKGSGPLEGVVVATKDGKIVSGSMQDGQYYIEIPAKDSVLVFSLEGYTTREIRLHDDGDCSVTLQPADPNIPPAAASPSGSANPAP